LKRLDNNRTVANVEVVTGHWERKVLLNLCLTIPNFRIPQTVLTLKLELELIDFGAEEVLKMKTGY
jgi:hypothetical protein